MAQHFVDFCFFQAKESMFCLRFWETTDRESQLSLCLFVALRFHWWTVNAQWYFLKSCNLRTDVHDPAMKNLKDQIIPFMKTRLEKWSLQWRPDSCVALLADLSQGVVVLPRLTPRPFAPSSPVNRRCRWRASHAPFVPATLLCLQGLSVLVPLPSLFLTA